MRRCERATTRRGTAYLMVLVGATIVAVIGLSAMAALRAQRAVVASEEDVAAARLLARAALERGMQMINDDGSWRTSKGAGWWLAGAPVGTRGLMSLQVTDPVDGDIANKDRDPVLLSAVGQVGSARSLVRMRMYATAGLGSLESAVHSGNDLKLDASTLLTDQRATANGNTDGSGGSRYYTDVEAAGDVKGATYHGGAKSKVPPRSMPDSNTIISTYALRGTVIAYTDLRDGGPNLTVNPSFEDGLTDWSLTDSDPKLTITATARTGAAAAMLSGRSTGSQGIVQDVSKYITSGREYRAEAWVRRIDTTLPDVRIALRVESQELLAAPVVTWYRSTSTAVSGWTKIDGLFDVEWKGTLQSAQLIIDTAGSTDGMIIDDVRIYEDGNNGPRRLREVLLSPESNPYGSGATNAQGVYIINCGGKPIIIEDCRIVGTLVLISPHSSSIVGGSVNWTAAVPNFPALIAGDDIIFDLKPAPLAEVDWGVSLNPATTPYHYPGGTGNTTLNDAFPSEIDGLIFGAKKLYPIRGTFSGVMMALDNIELKNASVRVNYNPIYMNSPPPGFDAVQRVISIEDGSYERWTD